MLTERVGLSDRVTIRQASALDLPFEDKSFDGAYSQNVSMNIKNKETFYAEAFRVVRPGGLFVAAEYAEGPGGPPVFPVPWALGPENSHLLKPDAIRSAIEAVGFEIVDFTDQSDAMIESYERAREKLAAEGPPVLSPRVLLGDDGIERLKNSALSTEEQRTIPVQVTCRRG
jgi:ubiquinone/menaquinone biosynthesis C-methylase UbiE